VSHAVNAVEREAGVALLVRSSNGVTLTENGKRLIPPIRALVNDGRKLNQLLHEMKGAVVGTLRIGTFTSVTTQWIPTVIRGFQEK
jgi:DNA-binding transcriptional LysR family regulator